MKTLGSATSTVRTPAQTAIGQFWNANVIEQYNRVFREVATQHNFDLVDAVRLLAMGNMVGSDAGITCMDSKYHYLLWRPVTAIRNADKDGNTATDPSSTWSPLLTTPNHPEYPSAHGCVTAAVTDVLAATLKTTNINIDVPGATGGGTTLTTTRHSTPQAHSSTTSPTPASGPACTTASPPPRASRSATKSANTTSNTRSCQQSNRPRPNGWVGGTETRLPTRSPIQVGRHEPQLRASRRLRRRTLDGLVTHRGLNSVAGATHGQASGSASLGVGVGWSPRARRIAITAITT